MASQQDENTKVRPYLPFKVGYLPKAIVAKAEKELGETEEVRAQTIHELRKLIESEPNFKLSTEETYLLSFLRPHKFSVKRAFEQIQTSFKEKKKFGNLYDTCEPESLVRTYGLRTIFCLPYRDGGGAAIFIVKMSNWDPDVSSADEFVTALTCAVFLCTADPVTQVCGIRIIIDVGGMRLKQARRLAPSCLSLIANALKNTLSARWVGIHVCNESPILPMVWTIFSLFLTEKIKSRVHFHGVKLKDLRKFIPQAILPVELGGDSSEDVGSWFNAEAENFLDRYAELCSYGYH